MRIKSFIKKFLTFTRIFRDFAMKRGEYYNHRSDLRAKPFYCGTDFSELSALRDKVLLVDCEENMLPRMKEGDK